MSQPKPKRWPRQRPAKPNSPAQRRVQANAKKEFLIILLFQPTDIRHIGPDAQAFKTAFAVGETNTGITGIDADGVALTGIQGLNKRLQGEVERLDAENADLRRRLEILDSLLPSSPSNSPTTTQGSAGGN